MGCQLLLDQITTPLDNGNNEGANFVVTPLKNRVQPLDQALIGYFLFLIKS